MKLRMPYALNEIGGRGNQEDSIFPAKGEATSSTRMFLVCDGMGGHENGEVASGLVCSTFASRLANIEPSSFSVDRFLESLDAAYDALDKADPDPQSTRKMGTTLTFLYAGNSEVTVAHMGDSRIYQLRPGSANPIVYKSFDHSLVNELVRAEIITPEEALTHPRRNVITRAMQPNLETRYKADVRTLCDVQAGDYFFMCSDGVLESISDDVLVDIVNRDISDADKIKLVQDICTANSRDNFSAYLIGVEEGTGFVAAPGNGGVELADELEAQAVVADDVHVDEDDAIAPHPEAEMRSQRMRIIAVLSLVVAAVCGLVTYLLHDSSEEVVPPPVVGVAEEATESQDNAVFEAIMGIAADTLSDDEPDANPDEAEDDQTLKSEESSSELKLVSNNSVTVSVGGVNGTIYYAITEPVDGVNIAITDDADWVRTRLADEERIAYTIYPNDSALSRQATITVTYLDESFEVVITQDGNPEAEQSEEQLEESAEDDKDADKENQ